jgi:Helicase associated domain
VPLTSRGEEHWNRFYELLRQYQQMHGHVLVPRLCEIPGLGDWVTDQRRQYKSWKQGQQSQLTPERREKLEQLGACRVTSVALNLSGGLGVANTS